MPDEQMGTTERHGPVPASRFTNRDPSSSGRLGIGRVVAVKQPNETEYSLVDRHTCGRVGEPERCRSRKSWLDAHHTGQDKYQRPYNDRGDQ